MQGSVHAFSTQIPLTQQTWIQSLSMYVDVMIIVSDDKLTVALSRLIPGIKKIQKGVQDG